MGTGAGSSRVRVQKMDTVRTAVSRSLLDRSPEVRRNTWSRQLPEGLRWQKNGITCDRVVANR
jgi:hypothetical protein